MSSISEVSIRRPVFAWMLMAALIVFGAIGFNRMGVSQLPDVDFPIVNVAVTLDGAAPEVMELDVVDPIESGLMGIQGIKNVSSNSKSGSANITVEFDLDKNIDVAVQEIQTMLGQVQRLLPKEMDPAVVSKSNPEDQPILWMAVGSDTLTSPELMALVRDRIKDRFTTIPGVADVFMGGYVDPNLRVWVSTKKLNQYELTINDIVRTVADEHQELPSGRIETAKSEMNIRTMGEATTLENFKEITVIKRGGAPNYAPIPLKNVATIEEGLADVRRISRSNGKPSVGLGIRKQRGTNAVEVAKAVKARMAEVQKQLPEGVTLGLRFDTTKFIEESIHELNFTLLISALLTALVCWMFLGSWSATLNVVLAIPTSIIGTFIVLYAMGFTLNTFTLLGLSLAIGIVVDDAIMVLENIVRHRELGSSRMDAALIGSKEITFAAMAATAAIIAIFFPVAFMKGIIGKFFYQFGVTLSVAVAVSLLEALTLTPMRCSRFLEIGERKSRIGKAVEAAFHFSERAYKRVIPFLLNHRAITMLAAVVFCVGTFSLSKLIKKEFVPPEDQGRLMVRVQTPPGSSIDFTHEKFLQMEKAIAGRPEIDSYFGAIGGFGGGDVNTANMFLSLKAKNLRPVDKEKGRPPTHLELAAQYRQIFNKLGDMKVTVQDPSLSGFSAQRGFPVEFTVRGPEFDKLIESSQKLMAAMEKSGQMTDVDSNYMSGMPEIRVVPDREKARMRNVSIIDLAQTIQAAMGGVIAGKYAKGGHRNDIRVRLISGERGNADDILSLKVRNNRGELIPLSELAHIEHEKSLLAISRQNRERAISVFANVAATSSQSQALETTQKLAKEILPPGYRAVAGGSAETFKESFQSLIVALVMGLIISYMILASQFNSFSHPITVLVALPFSVSGAFILLWATGNTLNIYSMIGLILLMGIVKKNSILLVDFTNQTREKGLNTRDALVEACPLRLRPIMMTSIATIAGAVPAAISFGPGAESRVPMAMAVIGGVVVSTALTLFVVPCLYSLLDQLGNKIKPKRDEDELPPAAKPAEAHV